MPVVDREETRARTELGAAQNDTARELGAELSSLTGIVWVGVGLFVLAKTNAGVLPAFFRLANSARLFQCCPMQSHELLREVFQKCSPKQVSANLGLSLSMIYKWAEPGDPTSGSGSTNPLDRIDALLRCTNDPRLVQWICQRAGGFFIRNPKTINPHPAYLIPATNEIVQEFADLLAVVAAAAADNQITQKESQQIRARWEELKAVTETFVACCEVGNFRPLREKQMGSPKPEVRSPPTDSGSGSGLVNDPASSGKAGDVKR